MKPTSSTTPQPHDNLMSVRYSNGDDDMARLTISISKEEADALWRLAEMECRTPRDQARWMLKSALLNEKSETAGGSLATSPAVSVKSNA